jgi:hypothetical protein
MIPRSGSTGIFWMLHYTSSPQDTCQEAANRARNSRWAWPPQRQALPNSHSAAQTGLLKMVRRGILCIRRVQFGCYSLVRRYLRATILPGGTEPECEVTARNDLSKS